MLSDNLSILNLLQTNFCYLGYVGQRGKKENQAKPQPPETWVSGNHL